MYLGCADHKALDAHVGEDDVGTRPMSSELARLSNTHMPSVRQIDPKATLARAYDEKTYLCSYLIAREAWLSGRDSQLRYYERFIMCLIRFPAAIISR